jgi:hypothetical protein
MRALSAIFSDRGTVHSPEIRNPPGEVIGEATDLEIDGVFRETLDERINRRLAK